MHSVFLPAQPKSQLSSWRYYASTSACKGLKVFRKIRRNSLSSRKGGFVIYMQLWLGVPEAPLLPVERRNSCCHLGAAIPGAFPGFSVKLQLCELCELCEPACVPARRRSQFEVDLD